MRTPGIPGVPSKCLAHRRCSIKGNCDYCCYYDCLYTISQGTMSSWPPTEKALKAFSSPKTLL